MISTSKQDRMKGGVHIRPYIILHLIHSIYDYYIAKKQVDFSNKKIKN